MVFIGKFGTNYEVGYYNIDGTHGLGEPDLSNKMRLYLRNTTVQNI